MQLVTSMFAALALFAMTVTVASAAGDVTGTLTHVNPQSRIIYFNDGRSVYLEPGATFVLDGRQVTIDQIRPGMRVVVSGARESAASSAMAPTVTPSAHPSVDAAGIVSSYDPQTRTVVFQDGRMFKLGTGSSVWQSERREAIRPGERIFVRHAQPTGYRSAWDAASMPRYRMGTVVTVDPANALVILNDGTVIRVSQATRVRMEGQPLTLSQVRPGDEVVIIGTARPVAGDMNASGMAMPRSDGTLRPFYTATFDASEIHLMRRPQAP